MAFALLLRCASRSVVVPLCTLSSGTSRHRALLFKLLCDACKIKCKLVRASVLGGPDSMAACAVQIDGGERYVDIIYAPGKLLTPEALMLQLKAQKMRKCCVALRACKLVSAPLLWQPLLL